MARMRTAKAAVLVAAAILPALVAGCNSYNGPRKTFSEAGFSNYARSKAQIRADLAGTTQLHTSRVHGPQIAYFAPDGTEYLWYPGNRVVLKARWFLRDAAMQTIYVPQADGSEEKRQAKAYGICFVYGARTYNPATGQGGGKPECTNANTYQSSAAAVRRGDVFRLSERTAVPFVTAKKPTTLDQLLRRCSDC